MQDHQHKQRVKEQLKKAGVTRYGLLKSESRHLPTIIHPNENIHGAVYGQYGDSSAMLVATDQRVIFLDTKPMVKLFDELNYDTVIGVEFDIHTIFATVILQTAVGNYTIRYANIKCAEHFTDYIETKRIDKITKANVPPKTNNQKSVPQEKPRASEPIPAELTISNQGLDFLQSRQIAVLSTVDRNGNVYGAVVYYTLYLDGIYILSKSSTHKARNIYAHKQVSLTIFDEQEMQTLQIQGIAEVEINPGVRNTIFSAMSKTREYKGEQKPPPVTKLAEDSFTIIRVSPFYAKFHDYAST